jgi:glycosyltransferase involved in cell wall biosynthesis
LTEGVEILSQVDNGEMAIGAKRNRLLHRVKGDYICFVDDDDEVPDNYISLILNAIADGYPDVCGLKGLLIRSHQRQARTFIHSIKYDHWFEEDGIYYRCPNHLNPVKRKLALQVGFPEKDFGEDQDYSMKLFPLLQTEYMIDETLYYYRK